MIPGPLAASGAAMLAAALGAGVHLRGGRGRVPRNRGGIATSSAHDLPQLLRAARAGADLAFLSPAFPTDSHPGATALGIVRWGLLARRARLPVAALGGIAGNRVRALPAGYCRGAGAIGALV